MPEERLPSPPRVARITERPAIFRVKRRRAGRYTHPRPRVAGQSTLPAPPMLSTMPPTAAPRVPPRVARWLGAALLVLAGVVTYQIQRPPQRITQIASGTAGLKTAPNGAHERWRSSTLTLTLDGSLDALPGGKDAVRAAFGAWAASGAPLPALTFDSSTKTVGAAQDGVSRVVYEPITITGHEHDLAITISYVDAATGAIVEADIVVNSTQKWGVLPEKSGSEEEEDKDDGTCKGRFDLENVVTHEGGHFFGLGEDMNDSNATMWYRSSPCERHKRALTAADKTVLTSLYEEPGAAPAGSSGSGTSAGAPSSGAQPQAGTTSGASSESGGPAAAKAGSCGAQVAPRSGGAGSIGAMLAIAAAMLGARRGRRSVASDGSRSKGGGERRA